MNEPEWLKNAKERGLSVRSQGVNARALGGGKATPAAEWLEGCSEEEFQGHVIDLAQACGWKVAHFRKVRVQRADGSVYWETPVAADGKGFPDLCFAKDDGTGEAKFVFFAELKVRPNKPTDEQKAWLLLVDGYLWYPEDWAEIVKVLRYDPGHDAECPHFAREVMRLADDGCPHNN